MAEKIKITHHYDEDADILYIDFGSDEPCFTEDLDGVLMIDIGWFSKLPRGAKIISPKARRLRSFSMIIARVEKSCKQIIEQRVSQIQTAEPFLTRILDTKLNEAFACLNN
jgi:hypothetical protein